MYSAGGTGIRMGTIGLEFISSTVALVSERKVVPKLDASEVSSFMMFRSAVVRLKVTYGVLSSLVTMPPVRV